MISPLRTWCLITLASASLARGQQVSIRGRVTSTSATAVADATISALTSDGHTVTTRSDSAGSYGLALAIGDSVYLLSASAIGYAQQQRVVRLEAGAPLRFVVSFRLAPVLVSLAPVQTIATRPRPVRDEAGLVPAPGQSRELLDVANSADGSATGSVASALAGIPGIVSTPAAGGRSTLSAFGVGDEQNGATLNGADVSSAFSLPRDGLMRQVRLSTYDPKYGRFAGVQVSTSMLCGCIQPAAQLHLSLDHAATPGSGSGGLEIRPANAIVSGSMADVLSEERTYLNVAWQVARQTARFPVLFGVTPAGLAQLGLDADSVARLRSAASSAGLPIGDALAVQSALTGASVVARLDLTNAPMQPQVIETLLQPTIYILASGSVSDAHNAGIEPTGTSLRSAHATRRDGQLTMVYSPFVLDALSETRLSVSAGQATSAPDVRLPAAIVQLSSSGVVAPELGGAGGAESSEHTQTLQLVNETSWFLRSGRHQFQFYGDVAHQWTSAFQQTDPNGTFWFTSPSALAASRPSAFHRSLGGDATQMSSTRGAVGLSSIFRSRSDATLSPFQRGEGLSAQYGVRMEAESFGRLPPRTPAIASFVPRGGADVPSGITVSPMIGLTWVKGRFREDLPAGGWFSSEKHLVNAGVREYRGVLSPQTLEWVAQRSGLPGRAVALECVGSAAPIPAWTSYLTDAGMIPTRCADGSSQDLAQSAPSAAVFASDFQPARSWRAELNWKTRVSSRLYLTAGSTYSLNIGGVQDYDLNFDGRAKSALASEGGRPLFVTAAGIDPLSGGVSTVTSRQSRLLGSVDELRSDLRSSQRQLTLSGEYQLFRTVATTTSDPDRAPVSATLRASYTHSRGTTEATGFSGPTAGDPRMKEVSSSTQPSHTVQMSVAGEVNGWFTMSLSAILSSGVRFTPMVAGDINGDGRSNDRAFIPRPDSSPAMSALLAAASPSVRECVGGQVGRIAATSSCVGPWSISPGVLRITLDPYRLGLRDRGSVSVQVSNIAGGVDALLHGNDNLRGWGQPAYPDAVLFRVSGFDPQGARFRYQVNPRFGTTQANQLAFREPVRLLLEFRTEIGASREARAVHDFMREAEKSEMAGSDTALGRYLINLARPFASSDVFQILRVRDSIGLRPEQGVVLEATRERMFAKRDSAYSILGRYLFARKGAYDDPEVRRRWHEAIADVIVATDEALFGVKSVLEPEQLQWLRAKHLAPNLFRSRDELKRLLASSLAYPR